MEHILPYRRCEVADLFSIDGEDCPEKAALIEASAAYLRIFAAPIKEDGKTRCLHCGETFDGMMHALGVGAAMVWGLAHGEATCSKCGWPGRGMHYPKGADGKELWTARNLFLLYHPDEVTQR